MTHINPLTRKETLELLEIAVSPGSWFDVATIQKRRRWEILLDAMRKAKRYEPPAPRGGNRDPHTTNAARAQTAGP